MFIFFFLNKRSFSLKKKETMTKIIEAIAKKWAINHIIQNLLIFKLKRKVVHNIVIISDNVKNTNKICFLLVTHIGIIKINRIILVIGQIIIWIEVFIILATNEFWDLGKKLLVINISQTKNKNKEAIVKVILLINKICFNLFFSISLTI